jgi:AmmeMemoRadiSam system protein A
MSFTESGSQTLGPEERRVLLELARSSIRHGLTHHRPQPVDPLDYAPALRELRAAFVTLNRGGRLRGCIGHLQACQALVQDVAENAYSAAFRDPRFRPLGADELADLEVHISVLSPPEPMSVSSEADLLRQIRPGIDGLTLEAGGNRGTFLPAVWESLPQPEQFLSHLKRKAGLPPDYWSDAMRVSRYTTEAFDDAGSPQDDGRTAGNFPKAPDKDSV